MISSIKKDTLWSIDYQCFNCFLAERVYSLETHKVKDSSGTPLQKSELNTNYLLAGVGAVIFMILFVIVIEIRRISKPSKRKPLLLPKRHENQTCDETFKRLPNGSSLTYLNKTSSKQSNHFSQHMDSVYHEIDESVELMQIPDSTDLPTAFGVMATFRNLSTT